MSDKIVHLQRTRHINHVALLHQVLQRPGLDGVVIVARIDGKWETCWGGEVNTASLCLAAMKLFHDVTKDVAEDDVT